MRQRIKEKGFTQAKFAEECGISHSALKKYMSGKNAYDYELLERFADKLDCSFDYLLGMSKSPRREFHEVTEQTHLSEQAIANIFKRAKYYEKEFEGRRYIKVLDLMLREEKAFSSICDFMIASKPMDAMNNFLMNGIERAFMSIPAFKEMDVVESKKIPLENLLMIQLVMSLKTLKDEITPDMLDELRKLEMKEQVYNSVAKLEEQYTK